MKSYILLENIEIFARHGFFEQETKVGNTFILNIKLTAEISESTETDLLSDTISYADVYGIITKEMSTPSKLLEHVGGRIIRNLKNTFSQIQEIELKISKRNPPLGGQVQYASIILID